MELRVQEAALEYVGPHPLGGTEAVFHIEVRKASPHRLYETLNFVVFFFNRFASRDVFRTRSPDSLRDQSCRFVCASGITKR